MHPEYPCAHCTFQSTAASVLRTFFGSDAAAFKLTSTTAPGVTRSFSRTVGLRCRGRQRACLRRRALPHIRRSRRNDGPQGRRVHGAKLSKTEREPASPNNQSAQPKKLEAQEEKEP